ncbi:uncharacterized protein DS421_12g371670 [Arachis hypogaea]|nr:uncharacterized protein DS421_12g371670 [Arachis hypogaea]
MPCAASFVAPHHHHRCRTSVSHRRRELLSSHHKQDPMRRERERQNDVRRERRHCGVVSAAATFSAIAICGARCRRSHELSGGGGHLRCVVAVPVLLLLCFIFLIVAAGVTGIATATSNVTTVAVDLPQFKFSVTALVSVLPQIFRVVSVFDSIKFNVAASVIRVGDAAIIPVVLESPLLL